MTSPARGFWTLTSPATMPATEPRSASFAQTLSTLEGEASFFGSRFIADAELRREYVDAARATRRQVRQGVRTGRFHEEEAGRVLDRLRAVAQQASTDIGPPTAWRYAPSLTDRQDWFAAELFTGTYRELARYEQARVDFEIVRRIGADRPSFQLLTLGADRPGSPLLVASIASAIHHLLAPPSARGTGLRAFVGGTLLAYLSLFGAPIGTGATPLAARLLCADFHDLLRGCFVNHPLAMVRQ